jgi:hypothetical protein
MHGEPKSCCGAWAAASAVRWAQGGGRGDEGLQTFLGCLISFPTFFPCICVAWIGCSLIFSRRFSRYVLFSSDVMFSMYFYNENIVLQNLRSFVRSLSFLALTTMSNLSLTSTVKVVLIVVLAVSRNA